MLSNHIFVLSDQDGVLVGHSYVLPSEKNYLQCCVQVFDYQHIYMYKLNLFGLTPKKTDNTKVTIQNIEELLKVIYFNLIDTCMFQKLLLNDIYSWPFLFPEEECLKHLSIFKQYQMGMRACFLRSIG